MRTWWKVPELPEVETVCRDLQRVLPGQVVTALVVTGARSVRRQRPDELAQRAAGAAITGVGRLGKYVVVRLDRAEALVVHLGMSGQLLLAAQAQHRPPHTHVTITLSAAWQLWFVDPRTFGEVFIAPTAADGGLDCLSHLGFDALAAGSARDRLAAALAGRRSSVKAVLMDQRTIAGIGNLYADEILHAAAIDPRRPAQSISASEASCLAAAMVSVLEAAIACRGSSLADQQYRDPYGHTGLYQRHHRVYARAGEPCARCSGAVIRDRCAGRSTFFCPACQH